MASCSVFIMQAVQRCEGHFIPIPGSSSKVRNAGFLEDCNEEEKYHLPRSSPVISRPRGFSSTKTQSFSLHGTGTPKEPDHEQFSGVEEPSQFGLSNNSNFEGHLSGTNSPKTLQNLAGEHGGTVLQNWPVEEKKAELNNSDSEDRSRGSSFLEDMDLTCCASRLETEASLGVLANFGSSPEEEQIQQNMYRTSMDLDQENAHFVVVDMVLEVLEMAKWNASQKFSKNSSFDSGYGEFCEHGSFSNRNSKAPLGRCSAEILAQRLLLELGRWWIPTDEQLGELPLSTISTAPGCEAVLSEEILQRSRMRGTLIWSPPQFQIISSMHLTQRRSDIIACQHFLCAGCGTEIEPRYVKRLRYCNYLGKYFCDSCHGGAESIIPARVLNHWDFGRYPVCQFSKRLLESIWEKPVFKITDINKNLYAQAKELQKFRGIQEQIISIKKLLSTCRLSEGVLVEFQQLPCHLCQELHLFSMEDLVRLRRGQLIPTVKVVMRSAAAHVEECELCQGKGFICEFCHGPDVLFPFQTDICRRCQDCRTCFHASCFRNVPCPKCVRIQARKSLCEKNNFCH